MKYILSNMYSMKYAMNSKFLKKKFKILILSLH